MISFDSVKNLFRYKTRSVEEFVNVVKRERCESARVGLRLNTRNATETASVGVIANFQYVLELTATTLRGRKVFYNEGLFERFGSDSGFADAEGRRNAAIKGLLLAERKVRELQTMLPGVSVRLIDPTGRPMSDATFAKLHQDAESCGVSV